MSRFIDTLFFLQAYYNKKTFNKGGLYTAKEIIIKSVKVKRIVQISYEELP